MADDERRREEKRNLELKRQKYDIGKQRDRAVRESMDHEAKKHDLTVENNFLKRDFDRELRDHHREKEAIERDHQQQINMRNLEHNREMDNERLKTKEAKRKFEKSIEKLEEEIADLNKEIEDKNVEITKIEDDHTQELNEHEKKLKTENEEKIKKMQEDHIQENTERELEEAKLTEDKKGLNNDSDRSKHDHELEIQRLNHVHQEEVEDAIEETNADWRKKWMTMERDFENKQKELIDEITYLENKIRDVQKDDDGRWKVDLKQKQNELDVMKVDLEQKLENAREEISDMDKKFRKEKLKINADHKMKLNAKVKEMNEDFKKKLEERVNALSYNLKYEINQKETDHRYKMERKDMELATMEEALSRAQAMKNDVGELMGYF